MRLQQLPLRPTTCLRLPWLLCDEQERDVSGSHDRLEFIACYFIQSALSITDLGVDVCCSLDAVALISDLVMFPILSCQKVNYLIVINRNSAALK